MPGRSARHRLAPTVMALALLGVTLASAGCATPAAHGRHCVSVKLHERTGHDLGPEPAPCEQAVLPPDWSPERPLTEEQAVLLALWNNAAFRELLVDLDLTRADLVQAGLLPNPEFVYFFGVQDKPLKYALDFPIEALWLRPVRLRIAGQDNARACERLTQAALDLIRDTRQAYADALLVRERVRVADEAVKIRGRVAELAEARLRAGDASEQEAATARINALVTRQDALRFGLDVPVVEERLRNLMGLGAFRDPLALAPPAAAWPPEPDADALTAEAVRTRPDALAAEHAAAAAAERVQFQRLGWVRFLGILDATSGRDTGHEFGPAFRVTVPLFNRNQGLVARAEADFERADRTRRTVENQIIQDVRQAHARYRQARAEMDWLKQKVQPEVAAAIQRAERAYKEGNVTYLIVLETTRQLIDTLAREAQLHADLRRAWAELERRAGRRLTPPAADTAPKPDSLP